LGFLQNLSSHLEERHVTFLGINSLPVLSVCDNYGCSGSNINGYAIFAVCKKANLVGMGLVLFLHWIN